MNILKIFGPPGTGKTRRMLELFEMELKKTAPNRIAFLTFTRAAKIEALNRSGRSQDDLPFLRTIHSICYRQLGMTSGQMVKDKDLQIFGRQIGVKLSGVSVDPLGGEEWNPIPSRESTSTADILLQLNHLGRHRRIGLKESLRDVNVEIDHFYAKWFTQQYHDWKIAEVLYDYTDILTHYLREGSPLPIDVLFVDEAQDLSKLQWDVIHKLGSNAERWYLAGDDDQAIFIWAGASPEQFMNEPCHEQQFLEQSYRLPRKVLEQSRQIIRRVTHRVEKPLRPRSDTGAVYDDSLNFDLDIIDHRVPTFVLFRNHWRGRQLAKEFMEHNMPFGGPHAPMVETDTRNLVTAWYKAITGGLWTPHEARIAGTVLGNEWLSRSVTDIKEKQTPPASVLFRVPTAEEWPKLVREHRNMDYVTRVIQKYGFASVFSPKVNLMSIHQSKGREADVVILDTCLAQKTFDSFFIDPESEHRVWYVAVTRAKESLHVIRAADIRNYDMFYNSTVDDIRSGVEIYEGENHGKGNYS